ncbi:hypothetical protein [Rhizobium sp. RCC_161_2]|uniref:hypothetical protein n=1 Tax=Rhizobium sp. RCC_161_2 TaxID=3239219 RepID=UPI0035241BC7
MTALARFRAVLTLWLLVRSIFLLNWLSPSSEVAEDQEAQTADFVEITTRRKTQAIAIQLLVLLEYLREFKLRLS